MKAPALFLTVLISLLPCVHSSLLFECGGVEVQKFNDETPPCRALGPRNLNPSHFRPLKILFLPLAIDVSSESSRILSEAFRTVNSELNQSITAPSFVDTRLPRVTAGGGCQRPVCNNRAIPDQYVRPCSNATPVEMESNSPDGAEDSDHQYSLVVYVHIGDEKSDARCRENETILGFSSVCGFEEQFMRPTHGGVVVCKEPSQVDPEILRTFFIHQVLHIMTLDLVGGYFYENPGRQQKKTNESELIEEAYRYSFWTRSTQTWLHANLTSTEVPRNLCTTQGVVKFVKSHFHCPEILGAELATGRSGSTDRTHWSMRLFPEEILSPLIFGRKVLSNLTLAYLKDSSWYGLVHGARIDPLFNRLEPASGCEAAGKSCHEVFQRWRKGDVKKPVSGSYCSEEKEIRTSLCSTDGSTRLQCMNLGSATDRCSVKIPVRPSPKASDHSECSKADTHPDASGFHGGPGSICVTVVSNGSHPDLYSACARHNCANGSVRIEIRPPNSACVAECSENSTSTTFTRLNGSCPNVEILCPDYEAICHPPSLAKSPGHRPGAGNSASMEEVSPGFEMILIVMTLLFAL